MSVIFQPSFWSFIGSFSKSRATEPSMGRVTLKKSLSVLRLLSEIEPLYCLPVSMGIAVSILSLYSLSARFDCSKLTVKVYSASE